MYFAWISLFVVFGQSIHKFACQEVTLHGECLFHTLKKQGKDKPKQKPVKRQYINSLTSNFP